MSVAQVLEQDRVPAGAVAPLRARWLGTLDYREAWDLQESLFKGSENHLLLLEHSPVYTLGRSADTANLGDISQGRDESKNGPDVVRVNRGGDVTYHGPGQLVGYPVLSIPGKRGGGMVDTAAYVHNLEQALIDVLAQFGLPAGRLEGFPGVWIDPEGPKARKIAAIGVRLSRGRSMHGFALNVDVDLSAFDKIVPCGIVDKPVTSMRSEGLNVTMEEVVDAVVHHVGLRICPERPIERSDVVHRARPDDLAPFSRGMGPGEVIKPTRPQSSDQASTGVAVRLASRLEKAGVTGGLEISSRKPDWMRVKLRTDENYRQLKKTARSLDLTTVCEEAGCPNIFECWNEGTATFMLLGERCTRACGFCLIDTRKPEPPDPAEPERVAEAVERLGIRFAVLTMVARDDLDDGGASVVAETVRAIRERVPGAGIEVLISDLKGSLTDLDVVCEAGPDIVNHNIETVARLQRAVRPSAAYGRSLTLLARAKSRAMTVKSGLIVGMGEDLAEVRATLADLAAVGVDIVTVGQYLRPTSHHLPIARWWTPEEFDEIRRIGEQDLGIAHVESSPLTRSSHHAGSIARGL